MSGATAWKPAAARASIWARQLIPSSGKPWTSSTSGPEPASRMCWLRRSVWMWRACMAPPDHLRGWAASALEFDARGAHDLGAEFGQAVALFRRGDDDRRI